MATNPNPSRVTDQMWWFWEQCHALEPASQLGGFYALKPGYHCTRAQLLNWIADGTLTRDYSIELPADKLGPGDKAAAFDWTFPDAQAGDYRTIRRFMERIRAAYLARDPRLTGWREALGQADADADPEGYDFAGWYTRTPDDSHLWHVHFSVLRGYVTDGRIYAAMLSVLRGDILDDWRNEEALMVWTETQMRAFPWQYTGGGLPSGVTSSLGALTAAVTLCRDLTKKVDALAGELAARDEADKARDALALVAIEALAAGGGADVVPIIDALDAAEQRLKAHYSAMVTTLQNDLAQVRSDNTRLRELLAGAAQAEADALGTG